MSYDLIPTPNFEKELKHLAKKYASLKSDLQKIFKSISEDPVQGDIVFKNCYKIRFSIKSKAKGKSGGGRLVIYVKTTNTTVFLLSVFDKSEQSTISDEIISYLLRDLDK